MFFVFTFNNNHLDFIMSRILFRTKCLSLALMSVFALTACNKESAPTQETAP